jgi:hypothetical protein
MYTYKRREERDMMDEQERPEANEVEMDEQEKQEVEEAERVYAEAEKQHTEAEERYGEAEKQHTNAVHAARQAGATRREEAEQRREAASAAEQFADAVRASYQAVADRSVSAQALNAQLTQQFFTDVINNLRKQAEDTREMSQQLADQQRRTQEAGQALTQESVGAYMNFVNSIFSFYQGSVQEEEGAEAAERGTT